MDSSGEAAKTQPVRVLAVDDNETIRDLVRRGLAHYGCVVQTAGSGREALHALMLRTFDVLVVDLRMEGMDGLSFLHEALKIWPWLGVVILTGLLDEESRKAAAQLGVTRLLSKPVGPHALYENVLEESRKAREHVPELSGETALALMRDHLKLLTRLGDLGAGGETLADSLLDFTRGLVDMLPSAVTGLLVPHDGERALFLVSHVAVSPDFLDGVEREMMSRFQTLSGRPVSQATVRREVRGIEADTRGPTVIGSTVSLPLISSTEVFGLLSMAAVQPGAYTPGDVSLLYHASNHLSAVLIALQRMHAQAIRDPLSGLFNRNQLEEELRRTWLLSRRYRYSMGVIVADIDHFKSLNDGYGHSAGDSIIREFAGLMQREARASDVIARYGGDEFVVVLPRAGEDDAFALGERLLQTTREHVFCPESHRIKLTVSIGVSTSLRPIPAPTSADLLSQADRALYVAKRAGRDRLCSWSGPSAGARVSFAAGGLEGTASSRVILVDDDEEVVKVLESQLRKDGYEVAGFSSGEAALSAIRERPGHYDVILTDLVMPGKSGIELLKEIGDADSSVVRIVLTGMASLESAVQSLRQGVFEYLQKPVRHAELSALVGRAVEYRRLRMENDRYQAHLEEMVRVRSEQLAASLAEVKESYRFTLEALMAMLDAREHRTGKHSARTRELTVLLARHMGVVGRELDVIAHGALLHDIGKIGLPDAVLLKEGPLQPEEWEVVKRHPEIGCHILRTSSYLKGEAEIVQAHHEHYDGSGYPLGIKGSEICIGARIFAVADALDAMCNRSSYRETLTPERAAQEIYRNRGTQFDPEVVKAFEACRPELEALLASYGAG